MRSGVSGIIKIALMRVFQSRLPILKRHHKTFSKINRMLLFIGRTYKSYEPQQHNGSEHGGDKASDNPAGRIESQKAKQPSSQYASDNPDNHVDE